MPFPALQSLFDPLYPTGLQWHWRADFFREISDASIEVHLKNAEKLPTGHSTVHLYPINGRQTPIRRSAIATACWQESLWVSIPIPRTK